MILAGILIEMAHITTTILHLLDALETLELEDVTRCKFEAGIKELRQKMKGGLEQVIATTEANPLKLQSRYHDFHREMLRVISGGCDRAYFDPTLKPQVFDEGKSSLCCFEAAGLIDIKIAQEMHSHEFALLIFNEILYQVIKLENYVSSKVYDREIAHPYTIVVRVYDSTYKSQKQ